VGFFLSVVFIFFTDDFALILFLINVFLTLEEYLSMYFYELLETKVKKIFT